MKYFFQVFFLSLFIYAHGIYHLENEQDIKKILPASIEDVIELKNQAINVFESCISSIYSLGEDQINYENVVLAFDRAFGEFHTAIALCGSLSEVVNDPRFKLELMSAKIELLNIKHNFLLSSDFLLSAIDVVRKKIDLSSLSREETFYLNTLIDRLKYYGADISEENKPLLIKHLENLSSLSSTFRSNIASKQPYVLATKESLTGLEESFIESLGREENQYKLTVDYPTFFHIMKYCTNSDIRKSLFTSFYNRGEPGNHEIVKGLIKERDALAKLMGYPSYSHYELSKEMATSPEHVLTFLNTLSNKLNSRVEEDINRFVRFIGIDPKGLKEIGMWDLSYYLDQLKQKEYQFDSKKFNEYFPLDAVFSGLIRIYEQFFHVKMEHRQINNLWDQDLYLITIRKDDTILGHVILDIFPRPDKYTHACDIQIVPAVKDQTALDLVIMNFPKSSDGKPSLLSFDAVNTFFHEFGHAIHDVLGRTNHYLSAGNGDYTGSFFSFLDFVELPSQLLEYWLQDEDTLHDLSCHYITKEKAPRELIRQFLDSANLLSGLAFKRQVFLSKLSLYDFLQGGDKDPNAIFFSLAKQELFPFVYPEGIHMQSAFGHLEEYGARYYGYLWSRVFACDVFKQLKQMGLNRSETGAYYVEKIISKGCSEDPNVMLKDFLGREPTVDAFLEMLGE